MIALKPAFDANNLISLFYKIVKGNFEVSDEHFVLVYTLKKKNTLDWSKAKDSRFSKDTFLTHCSRVNLSVPYITIL